MEEPRSLKVEAEKNFPEGLGEEQIQEIYDKISKRLQHENVITKGKILKLVPAILLAAISVIPNFMFGGTFAVDVANKLNSKLEQDDINIIRDVFGSISGIVNAFINARSTTMSMDAIWNTGRNIYDANDCCERLTESAICAAKLLFAFFSAIPNLQYVEDTVGEKWSPGYVFATKAIVFLINMALTYRGFDGVMANARNSWPARIFPSIKKEQDEAMEIRKSIIGSCKDLLFDESQISLSDDDMEKLARGELYDVPYGPKLVIKAGAFILPALFYTAACYFTSAKEATFNLKVTRQIGNPLYIAYFVAVCATLGRGMLLGNSSSNVCDSLLDPIGRNILTLWASRESCSTRLYGAVVGGIKTLFFLLIAIASLTGAFGSMNEYYFDNAQALWILGLSIAYSTLGALNINYEDFVNGVNGIYKSIGATYNFLYEPEANVPQVHSVAREIVTMKAADLVELKCIFNYNNASKNSPSSLGSIMTSGDSAQVSNSIIGSVANSRENSLLMPIESPKENVINYSGEKRKSL